MKKIPFVGPSYVYRSISFDGQRSVNLMPIKSEIDTSKDISALMGTPGLRTFLTLPKSPIRACRNIQERGFVVAGNSLYEIFVDGTFIERGLLDSSTGFVSMSDNGLQLIMVDGPNGHVFTLLTNAFVKITSPNFLGADTVTFLDGYFVLNKPDSQIYYISALYDGLTYNALDFASAEGSPDFITAVWTIRQECWLFGRSSIQVVYNSGGADFPLTPIQGAFVEYGCTAPQSVAKTANSVFWLGQDADGAGVVWMATGYQPQRISTSPIETRLASAGDLSTANAYTYQEEGRYFYVLNVQSASTTFVYDVGLQQWHERADWVAGEYQRHRGQCHMYIYGKNIIGDYQTGAIYEQSLDFNDYSGAIVRRMRTCPHLHESMQYVFYNTLQVDMQVGVGEASGAIEDTDPQVMLQWSDDGGYTWSSERWVSAGKIGEYKTRAIWRRLGRARDRVFRVVTANRCKTMMIASYADMALGAN